MGESYRGLTIRIGADTNEFQKAMVGIMKAAGDAQTELARIGKALKLDPNSTDSMTIKVKLLSESLQNAAAKMTELRNAENQMDAAGIRKAADETENISLRVATARQQYDRINGSIENLRKTLQAMAKENGFKRLAKSDDIELLVQGLQKAADETGKTQAKARELGEEYKRLRAMWGDASDELDLSKKVSQFRDLQIEIQLVSAESRKMIAEFTALKATTAVVSSQSAEFRNAREQMEIAGRAAESLRQELARIDDAIRLDPSSIDLVVMKQRDMREAAKLARDELKETQKQLKELSKHVDMGGAEKSLEGLHGEFERLKAESVGAEAAVQHLKGRIQALKEEEKELRVQMAEGKDVSKAYTKVADDIRELEAKLKSLEVAAEKAFGAFKTKEEQMQVRQLETRVAELNAEIKKLSQTEKLFGSIGSIMRSFGTSLSSTVTPAITMTAVRLMDYAEQTDAAFRAMKKTVNASSEEVYEDLRMAALEFSKSNAVSAETLLNMEALGGQMGIAADALGTFGSVAANIDIATDIDAENVALYMGQFANITHMATEEYESFADSLVRLGNNMPAQESQIMKVAMRIASMGTIVGMTQPEILAWSATIAATGQKAEAAGTAISRTMSNIEQAVSAGGEDLQAFAAVAGTSATRFATLWRENPSAALKEFIEGMVEINNRGGSLDSTLANLGINGVRQKQALMGLTQTIGVLGDALEMSGDAWEGVADQWGDAGDAAREAGVKSEGLSGALQILRNNAEVLGSEIGDSLEPMIRSLAKGIGGLADAYANMGEFSQMFVVGTAAIIAAAGPMLRVFGSIATVLDERVIPSLEASKVKFAALRAENTALAGATAAEAAAENVSRLAKIKNTVAAGALTVANGAAAVSAKVLNFALKAIPFVAIASAVVSLVMGIAGLVKASMEAAYMSDDLNKSIHDLSASAEESARQFDDMQKSNSRSVDKAVSNAAMLRDLGTEYRELADTEERTAEQEVRFSTVKAQLASASDELAFAVSREGDASGEAARQVQLLAEAEADSAVQAARQEAANKLMETQLDLMSDRMIAAAKLAEAQERLNGIDSQGQWVSTGDGVIGGYYDQTAYTNAKRAVDEASDAVAKYDEKIQEAEADIKALSEVITEDMRKQAQLNEAVKRFTFNGGDMDKALEGLTISAEDLENELDKLSAAEIIAADSAKNELSESLMDAMISNRLLAESIGGSETVYDSLANSMLVLGMSADDLGSYLDSLAQKAVDAFNEIEMGTTSVDEAMATLQANAEATVYLREMMTELWQSTAYTMNEEFMEAVRSNPEQYYAIIEEMLANAESGNEELIARNQEFIDSFAAGAAEAAQAGVNEAIAAGEAYEEAGRQGVQSISEGMDDTTPVEEAASGVADSAVEALASASDGAATEGMMFDKGYAEAIAFYSDLAVSAAAEMGARTLAALQSAQDSHSPSRKTRKIGVWFGQGYELGIEDETPYIKQASQRAYEMAAAGLYNRPAYPYAQNASDLAQIAVQSRNAAMANAYGNAMQTAGVAGGDTYNVYINDARINDDEAIRNDVIGLLLDAKRAGDM